MTQKQIQHNEEREELGLYLFKGHARTKMLSFKRILGTEFPLRMLPLDQLELQQDEDGFDMIVQTPTTVSTRNSSPRSQAAASNPGTAGASKRRGKSRSKKHGAESAAS